MSELVEGDKIEVERVTAATTWSEAYSTWKPAVFWKYEGKRVVCKVRTPAGVETRSFPAERVRKI